MPDERIYLGLVSLHQFNFYLVRVELPGPPEDILSEQTRIKTDESTQNLRPYHFLEESNRVVVAPPKFQLVETMAVFRSHKCKLALT